ncbi:MAG TPA: CoA transferase [Hyphomicrobiaceae bacterium]|jgi:crotonobetainyl-CoA:carnitine CoA-transferase CaiB-like acyl-CoA transferase|nr:CoA transferase [Hyphomicrobiaceae bacterium]
MIQPLSGIRVIDLTRVLSGPFSTMLLADMGADVVKIETPQGDTVRDQGTVVNGLSCYFASFNRNKRSVVLDLRKDEGKAVLAKLLEHADVLVENFRPGVLAEMGFDEARLNEINRRLIVASINGYGSIGPYVERPSFDFIAQAMSGFMATTGAKDGPPMRAGAPITDLVAGLYCAFGVVNAIRARELTGRGQRVEAAMVNGMVSMLAYLASEYLSTGRSPERNGNDHPIASPYGLFQANDGDIAIAPATPEILQRFMRELNLADVLDRPDMKTAEQRRAARPELNARINEKLSSNTQEHWIERLNAVGVPCGKVLSVAEVLQDPQVLTQDMVIEVDHGPRGVVRMVGFPVKLSDTPARVRHPAPELGAHTDEVLAQAGYSEQEISGLRLRQVVG